MFEGGVWFGVGFVALLNCFFFVVFNSVYNYIITHTLRTLPGKLLMLRNTDIGTRYVQLHVLTKYRAVKYTFFSVYQY